MSRLRFFKDAKAGRAVAVVDGQLVELAWAKNGLVLPVQPSGLITTVSPEEDRLSQSSRRRD